MNLSGFKTVLLGLFMAIFPAVTQYVGAIDWATLLPGPWGVVLGGIIMALMRFVTTTPVFTAKEAPSFAPRK